MSETRAAHKVFFETLGNTVRWQIVHALKSNRMTASEIARAVDAEQSLTSHHLKRLRECGFVHRDKDGRKRVYTLNEETMEPLLELLDEHINTYCKDCSFRHNQ